MQKLINVGLHWHLSWDKKGFYFYVRAMEGYHKDNGKYAQRTVYLHRFVMEAPDGYVVDHRTGADKLDNRKKNLRIVRQRHNTSNRKGANINNKTGNRNVTYMERSNEYWVQIMKDGQRYKWIFPIDEFEKACEFARNKRKELFGQYAGKG